MSNPSEILILCPYCLSPIGEEIRFCPVCLQDTSRDAKVEMTQAEYARQIKTACYYCGKPIPHLANTCAACRQKQS